GWRFAMLPQRSRLLNLLGLVSLVLSACSSGGGGGAGQSACAPTSAPATAAAKPTPGQSTGAPPPTTVPAAPPPAQPGQPGQGSSQASGDLAPTGDAPTAPIVARSRTTGRPITLEVWLTDWEQGTQRLFNDELVPAFEATNPDIAVNLQYLDWRVF